MPCELRDGNLVCIGAPQSCSITSATESFAASCPALGRIALELDFAMSAETES
ncbi:MAG: hypothetical protein QXS37_03905 [Candidatus Aenigmatarchaeota archaeon]